MDAQDRVVHVMLMSGTLPRKGARAAVMVPPVRRTDEPGATRCRADRVMARFSLPSFHLAHRWRHPAAWVSTSMPQDHAAVHPSDGPLSLELVEVAADRRQAHVEVGRQLLDCECTVTQEQGERRVEALKREHHRPFPRPARAASSTRRLT